MRSEQEDLSGLARLHEIATEDDRRAAWRRAVATLAAVSPHQSVPLEGYDAGQLHESVRIALADGLLEDMSWLKPSSAATALFSLAIALPRSSEKRELGRLVLRRLHGGNAETFAALATSLASTSPKVISGRTTRARVLLALALPRQLVPARDSLALSLLAGESLVDGWIRQPSMGSLSERRLVAIVFERAAREAALRNAVGNDAGLRALDSPMARQAWVRLLADREALAWRPIAAARGLLCRLVPRFASEIERDLRSRDVGALRRGAVSLASSVAVDPEEAAAKCHEFLDGPQVERDRGSISALVYGLCSAVEDEPEAAAELAARAATIGSIDSLEAVADFCSGLEDPEVASAAQLAALDRVTGMTSHQDEGVAALATALATELGPAEGRQQTLRECIVRALALFAHGGVEEAADATREALETAQSLVAAVKTKDIDIAEDRQTLLIHLRDLDSGLLTDGLLQALSDAQRSGTGPDPVEVLRGELRAWLLTCDRRFSRERVDASPFAALLRFRTLLHAVDVGPSASQSFSGREERLAAITTLYDRATRNRSQSIERIVHATLARACDAGLRDQSCELSDVFLAVTAGVGSHNQKHLMVLADATLIPDVERVTVAYSELLAQGAESQGAALAALRQLIDSLPWASSARVEALRGALLELEAGLLDLSISPSLRQVAARGPLSPLARIATGAHRLANLVTGARRRLGLADPGVPPITGQVIGNLHTELGHEGNAWQGVLRDAFAVLDDELPNGIALAIRTCLLTLTSLPVEAEEGAPMMAARSTRSWQFQQRSVGGFYLLRPLGQGAAGSVYLACRNDHRHERTPETVAVKVPQYTGDHAEVLTEEEFLQAFREEAGALLTLPQHENLAGFVTFDLGAKPQPVLVMEYVEGQSLAELQEAAALTLGDCAALVRGIGAGLAAMHQVGVAHLDIKPENVIVREGIPVLVDFGLSGRKLRPGCATVHYGAPEVWVRSASDTPPMPADVYGLSCLAFELATGAPLIDADTPKECIAAHLGHDGDPPLLQRLQRSGSEAQALAAALRAGLQPDPYSRSDAAAVSSAIVEALQSLSDQAWPLRLSDEPG